MARKKKEIISTVLETELKNIVNEEITDVLMVDEQLNDDVKKGVVGVISEETTVVEINPKIIILQDFGKFYEEYISGKSSLKYANIVLFYQLYNSYFNSRKAPRGCSSCTFTDIKSMKDEYFKIIGSKLK